jgi:hypothetical protein
LSAQRTGLATALLLLASACSDDGATTAATDDTTSSTSAQTGSGGATSTTGTGGGTTSTTTTGTGGGGGPDPFAGPVKSLTEVDLGQADIGSNVFFDLPDRVLGLTLLAETTPDRIVGVFRLRPPSASSVISQYAIPGVGLQVFGDYGSISAGSPQSDLPAAWPVQSGSWWLLLGSDTAGGSAHTRLWVRRTEDGSFHGGAVDINVFVSPGSGASQAYLGNVLSSLFASYYTPKIGLTLGNVAYYSAPSSYDNVSTTDEYRSLLASSAGVGSAPALNLFVIGSFSGDYQNALGVAGGIPGSPMSHGTPRSGVAFTPTGMAGYDASVLAHEVGHLAGLFHTTEYQVTAFDPLADTPECASNVLNGNPSNCPDVSNVMFPIAYGGSVMTAWQARVMQGSALYRGSLTEGGPFSPPLSPPPPGPGPAQLLGAEAPAFTLARVTARPPKSELERTLSAHFCAKSPEILDQLAAHADRAEVATLALDPDAFDVTRAHAIAVLARMSELDQSAESATELRRVLEVVLSDASTGRHTTLAAATAAAGLDVDLASTAADRLAGSLDPTLREAALEVSP